MTHFDLRTLKKYSRSLLYAPLRRRASLSEIFHENTKLAPLSGQAYGREIAVVLGSPKIRRLLSRPYKDYSLMDRAELPEISCRGELRQTIAGRRSVRRFSGEPASREELSQLLFFGYGRTDDQHHFRAVPSGGGLYPLEIYVVALAVDGLEPGVYHYGAEDHHLDVVSRGDFRAEMKELVMTSGIDVDHAAMVVIFTAVFPRNTLKYKDRGYRMILMECGAAAHGMSLVARSLGLGDCYVGGFLDDELSRFLEIDGVQEAPLLPLVIGRQPAATEDEG